MFYQYNCLDDVYNIEMACDMIERDNTKLLL